VLPPSPGTCPDIYQPLKDLEAWLATVGAGLMRYVQDVVDSMTMPNVTSQSTCADLASEVDLNFSRVIQQAQTAYDGLRSAAVTQQEQSAVSASEKTTDLAAWRRERDKSIAAILKFCN
jgi:hypothetical protein